MKRKHLLELRKKSKEEIEKLLRDREGERTRVAPEIKLGRSKNVRRAKNMRREIAQLKTVLSEKETEA